jgi:antitoxin CcdA
MGRRDMADGKTGKTLLEVEIDAELAAEAAARGVDLSATLEEALTRLKTSDRGAEWRRRNAPALAAYDRHIEGDGLWSDGLRTW